MYIKIIKKHLDMGFGDYKEDKHGNQPISPALNFMTNFILNLKVC